VVNADAGALRQVLATPPDETGGRILVLATAGPPPALAVLSTGDVVVAGDRLRVGLHATSSAVARLGGAFSLLVPADEVALRVEVIDAVARTSGDVAVLDGRIAAVRPTAEPPWRITMEFRPDDPADPRVRPHLRYWAALNDWLAGRSRQPPAVPHIADP
jgi:hypothetical protein